MFHKVKEVLMAAHDNEPDGEGKKKLAQALDLMKEHEDLKEEAKEGDLSEGDDGGANAEPDGEEGADLPSEQPEATIHIKVPLKLHEMPLKDLEKHVKGMKQEEE